MGKGTSRAGEKSHGGCLICEQWEKGDVDKGDPSFAFVDVADDNFTLQSGAPQEEGRKKQEATEGSLEAEDWRVCGTVLV